MKEQSLTLDPEGRFANTRELIAIATHQESAFK
jgi:hypothetical protein